MATPAVPPPAGSKPVYSLPPPTWEEVQQFYRQRGVNPEQVPNYQALRNRVLAAQARASQVQPGQAVATPAPTAAADSYSNLRKSMASRTGSPLAQALHKLAMLKTAMSPRERKDMERQQANAASSRYASEQAAARPEAPAGSAYREPMSASMGRVPKMPVGGPDGPDGSVASANPASVERSLVPPEDRPKRLMTASDITAGHRAAESERLRNEPYIQEERRQAKWRAERPYLETARTAEDVRRSVEARTPTVRPTRIARTVPPATPMPAAPQPLPANSQLYVKGAGGTIGTRPEGPGTMQSSHEAVREREALEARWASAKGTPREAVIREAFKTGIRAPGMDAEDWQLAQAARQMRRQEAGSGRQTAVAASQPSARPAAI